jgi:hypothetical protein
VASCPDRDHDRANARFTMAMAMARDPSLVRQEHAVRIFLSLLRGGAAWSDERMWSARMLSTIYRQRRACKPARAMWLTYQKDWRIGARQRGQRGAPPEFPGCR